MAIIQLPVSFIQKGFPFRWRAFHELSLQTAGEILQALCHYPKKKVTTGNTEKSTATLNCYVASSRMYLQANLYTETDTELDNSAHKYEHLHSKTHPDYLLQASTVYLGSPSIHADSWLQRTGTITVEYHYLKAFADLDSA